MIVYLIIHLECIDDYIQKIDDIKLKLYNDVNDIVETYITMGHDSAIKKMNIIAETKKLVTWEVVVLSTKVRTKLIEKGIQIKR